MAEVLPSTAEAWSYSETETEMPDDGISKERTETGPSDVILARRDYYRGLAMLGDSGISCLVCNTASGRGTLQITYNRVATQWGSVESDNEIQELSAFDIIRDIKSAFYFSPLTDAEMSAVQQAWDNRWKVADIPGYSSWNAGQKALYGHMAHGQESFIDTAYEFRRVFQTSSNNVLKRSAANPNTVTTLPTLTRAMSNLIDNLPATGEWLKKPTVVQYAGRKGWIVTEIYHWAKQWSVIYGGSFTGL